MTNPNTHETETAHQIVLEHIDWMRNGRPKPIGGFPPEYYADELADEIAQALASVRESCTRGRRNRNVAILFLCLLLFGFLFPYMKGLPQ